LIELEKNHKNRQRDDENRNKQIVDELRRKNQESIDILTHNNNE